MVDIPTLTINGTIYSGWTSLRVSRGIDRMAADFDIAVTERWAGAAQAWQIAPFDACTIHIGGDLVLTGFVDDYLPGYDETQHRVRVPGRSKTADLIDCTPEIAGGQFTDNPLDAIARAVCQPFGIGVVVQAPPPEALFDSTYEPGETAFHFLERLTRLSRVLMCDDENGNLVLTVAASARAAGSLVEGQNILAAAATLSARHRFSKYIVLGQAGMGFNDTDVENEVKGVATDTGPGSCPPGRYRPHATIAESALLDAEAQERAQWQAVSAAARGTQAQITVAGWRQPNGKLWAINQRIPVKSPKLKLDRELLIAGVSFTLDPRKGARTELTLGPAEAYTPDPGEVRLTGALFNAATWQAAKNIQGGAAGQ
jgi:prophage tail gpP-like protein